MTLAIGLLLALAACAVVRAEAAGPTWRAAWTNLETVTADWSSVGAPCYSVTPGRLHMLCQSAGLTTRQTWARQFPLTVTAAVSASAASGARFFAGLTIYDAASNDTRYGELALAERVPPFGWVEGPAVGVMVDEWLYQHAPAAAGWNTLTLSYWPDGHYEFSANGQALAPVSAPPLAHDPVIFVLCVSVGEATPDDGSAARCDFGPVTVEGTLSAAVRQTYLPSVAARQMGKTQ